MEKEQSPSQLDDLKTIGEKAADALRGYGYDDLAEKYEQVLRRSALDSRELLTHSRIASNTLKELNELAESKQGRHPALDRNIQLQQQLETTLEKQSEVRLDKAKSISELSFPAKLYLKEKSKPLANAAQEVANYLDGKRQYSHSEEGKTPLQRNLDTQLQSYRSLPTSQNMEKLEQFTQQGIQVMKQDYEIAKAALQKENEQYVANRNYLSSEGRALILNEAEKGEFEMPNRVAGKHVIRRADYAQELLDQYGKVKEKILTLDQERENYGLPGTRVRKDYAHLSAEQHHQYENVQRIALPLLAKSQENELEQ